MIESNGEPAVSAKGLHSYLKSKQQFGNWINDRIDKYGFREGQDFLINLLKSTGGRPSKDYVLTMDTAKEISMVEAI
ncbi:antA/AntB antirepressor family protein [Segetibacter koreensis]|uniref:antA/AntB antirepressor family protein n=1 Tax=Segetibacter koreensis TaxID=398037 RepID=UPI000A037AFE